MRSLERARAVIETRFLSAGEVLGLAVEGVGQLIGALDQLARALDPQTVEATHAELLAAASSLVELRDGLEARRERTHALSRLAGGLGVGIEDMRRDLAYLRVFALNIKVAAGGVIGSDEGFPVFAQEISDRIEAGRVELDAFAQALGDLDEQLAAALAQEQTLTGECDRLIPVVPQELERCAQDIGAHHAGLGQAAAEAGELARGVRGKVGAALGALQVGDSTRQRIEHIQLGFGRLDAAHGPAAVRAVRALLAAQLAAAADDFNRDSAQVHHSLSGLSADAAELLRVRELAFGRGGGEAFLDRMIEQLGRGLELVGRVEAADDQAMETARTAAEAVEALSERIAALQAIKTDVQQMALNATLKCARMGDPGKPLSVIAIELRNQARLLDASAQRALGTLGELAAMASDLAVRAADRAAGEALRVATDRLARANTTVEADLPAVVRQGEAVVAALQDAAARLDFRGEIGGVLEAAAAGARPAEAPGTADAAAAAEILEAIAASYTMARERQVHAAALPPSAPPPPAAAAALEAVLF